MHMFIGTILSVPNDFLDTQEHTSYVPCDGRILNIAECEELFTLLGTAYGGDGLATFGVPTLTNPLTGFKYVICTKGTLPEYDH